MATQIAEYLRATLSPDPNARIAAELKLSEVSTHPEAGLVLSQIVASQDSDVALRQMTSIVLRKYVRERWSPFFSQFRGSAPPVEVKTQIRQAVFQGLSDPLRKIRSLSAVTLSLIANSDWPEEYPDLLTSLISLLSSQSTDSVHGAMQVFVEFVKADLTEDQLLPVLRELLPVLLDILGDNERHSPLTRSRTITVFKQCVEALYMVKDSYPQAVKEATASVLPTWLDAFKVLLAISPQGDVENTPNWDGLVVRSQIFKTLDGIHMAFPKVLAPYLPDFLNASLHHLNSLFPTFSHYYVSSLSPVPSTSEDDTFDLVQLIVPILDFVATAARSGKAKAWFDPTTATALTSEVYSWLQMTSDDEEEWASNANTFISQDSDETAAYSTRVAGFELLAVLLERYPQQTVPTFQTSVQRILAESQQARDTGNNSWWKSLEAVLAALGSLSEPLLDYIDDEEVSGRPKPIDIESLLANMIPTLLSLSQYPFLQGRAFVFASQYSKLLPSQLTGQYLEAAVQVVEAPDAGIPVKVSAIKAIHNFFNAAEGNEFTHFAPRIAQDIGPFLLVTTEDTLSLVLDTLAVVIDVEKAQWITTELASSLVGAVLEVWTKFNKDPILISILTDIVTSLASSKASGVYETVVRHALPPLCQAIANPSETWIASAGIELITSLVQGAPETGLGDGFFSTLAPNLFQCLKVAEDRDIIQNGIHCLTLIIRKDFGQLWSWTNPLTNESGLDSVLAVVAKQLQGEDEAGGLVIGDLIIHLLRKAGQAILPVLPGLLQAMVARMPTVSTATFAQSLIIPFAFLIHNDQRDTVITLLEGTDIQGRSGLDILVNAWCENAETFQGFWATRVSTLALCSLYVSERPSLQNLIVKGDIIMKPETDNVIMTRSKTKKSEPAPQVPTEFTSIPFPVKAIKLLLHDLQSNGEAAAMGFGDASEVATDDGDEDWAEEEKLNQGFSKEEYNFLSDMLGPRGVAFDNDEALDVNDNDDEDLKADPISQIDLKEHILTFLRECAARNTGNFSAVADQLTADETLVVRKAVTAE